MWKTGSTVKTHRNSIRVEDNMRMKDRESLTSFAFLPKVINTYID